jgi:hypothetical protein
MRKSVRFGSIVMAIYLSSVPASEAILAAEQTVSPSASAAP